jgi:hypothetical protein
MLESLPRETFQVVELRRYTMNEGKRDEFIRYFESYFPEAFQQLGSLFLGHFRERSSPVAFTMVRGFKTLDERAVVCAAFYYGQLWKEHRTRINDRLATFDNVLLLRPLNPERGVLVLPAVDVVNEPEGARGVVVAQIFAVQKEGIDAFAGQAEPAFAAYRAAGVREAGVLVTLDVPNNFPQHPIRTDGPYLVWLGVMDDSPELLERFQTLAAENAGKLAATGQLRGEPELVILDPARRSRLRWLPGGSD